MCCFQFHVIARVQYEKIVSVAFGTCTHHIVSFPQSSLLCFVNLRVASIKWLVRCKLIVFASYSVSKLSFCFCLNSTSPFTWAICFDLDKYLFLSYTTCCTSLHFTSSYLVDFLYCTVHVQLENWSYYIFSVTDREEVHDFSVCYGTFLTCTAQVTDLPHYTNVSFDLPQHVFTSSVSASFNHLYKLLGVSEL